MSRKTVKLCQQTITPLIHDLIYTIDQTLEYVYKHIEVPLQNIFSYFGKVSYCYSRRRSLVDYSRCLTQVLVEGYVITCLIYVLLLLFGYLFSIATERHYFNDPLLSYDRQCIDIKFVRVTHYEDNFHYSRLQENFLKENYIFKDEIYYKTTYDYSQIYKLIHLIENEHYIICQRSLYIYSRFQSYSSLLHSNYSLYKFVLSNYPSSFSIDQPPFIDLCLHTSNLSHLNLITSRLIPLASYYYSSINLFIFDFKFTQITLTLYQLNSHSNHLERVSIHTGWLYDMYSRFYFFKYHHSLSTILFDGLPTEHYFTNYFDQLYIPLPADPLLGLNEMVQQSLLILPLCHSMHNITNTIL